MGKLEEKSLSQYFWKFGSVFEVQLLRDKKTKKSRGQAFVTIDPAGSIGWKKQYTHKSLRQFLGIGRGGSHIIYGTQVEITEAEIKDDKAGQKQREEFRQKAREEREQRINEEAMKPPPPPNWVATAWATKIPSGNTGNTAAGL